MECKYSLTTTRYWKIPYFVLKLRKAPTNPLGSVQRPAKTPRGFMMYPEGICEVPFV